jgi:putative endopeptidase
MLTYPVSLIIGFLFSINPYKNNFQTEIKKGLSLQNINPSVKPGDDFYMYANGKWYDTATVLPTESRAGTRLEMSFITKARIKNILEKSAAAKNKAGSLEQKIGDFFKSGMDTVMIEKLGYTPIKPILQKIDAIKDANGILKFVAEEYREGIDMLLSLYVAADKKNSKKNIAVYLQTGLGLPDRNYYFKQDAATLQVVSAYKNYLFTLFKLTGDDSVSAMQKVNITYDIEKQMAESHRTNVELRDPQLNYNKIAVADLDKQMPVLGWKTMLGYMRVKTDSVNVAQPGYYKKLDEMLRTVPLANWKIYLRVHTLQQKADALSTAFVNAAFNYNGKVLSGQKKLRSRSEIVYEVVNSYMADALGQVYVKKYFTPEAKQKMLDLVNNLQKAMQIRINKLDWMSDSTKQVAIAKLYAITKKIGYPDKWIDYSNVNIKPDDFIGNVISCSRASYNRWVNRVDKPVDKKRWGVAAQTNDAYYNPTLNEIAFPSGILQFPMFDIEADDAMNYGAIGMVIGHEITHAFDDQGAQYDKDGNLKNWWKKEDYEKFKAKGEQVVAFYNGFTVLDTLHINGRLTQGENTADIGGIAIAYEAFKLTKQGKDTTRIQGFTPDQRFFLSYAQSFRRKIKDEAMRRQVNTDPHSPSTYRVNGPLMNFTPFYTAFNVKPGDKMYKPESERIRIW